MDLEFVRWIFNFDYTLKLSSKFNLTSQFDWMRILGANGTWESQSEFTTIHVCVKFDRYRIKFIGPSSVWFCINTHGINGLLISTAARALLSVTLLLIQSIDVTAGTIVYYFALKCHTMISLWVPTNALKIDLPLYTIEYRFCEGTPWQLFEAHPGS